MQLRRRKGAAAVAAAVIAGTLGGAPSAFAAPAAPGTPTTSPDDHRTDGSLPSVWPRPQSMKPGGTSVLITDEVTLVTAPGTDPYALSALRTLLRDAGARHITEVGEGAPLPAESGNLVVHAATDAASARDPHSRTSPGNPAPGAGHAGTVRGTTDQVLRTLGARPANDLPSGGYRLAAGRGTVALAGVGEDGLFHAVQTLRQLVGDRRIPGVVVRDWPGTAVRGITEGFYGTPWTREQRLDQLDFMGRTKQNRYLYAPGDDLYRQARWREPYPAAQRADFRALAERARRNHVTLAWAVAPGQAMCLADDGDVKALNRKLDAMWALGVRAFQLQFQDVSYSEWHCSQDAETFGSGPEAAAAAQARVANAVARHLAERHPDAAPLSLMPTEYYQDGSTAYRRALAHALEDRVEVAWTGIGVVPRTITGRELAATRGVFGGHRLVTMDNYPVNDFSDDRIFLGPYSGREPAVAAGSAALLANAMEQPTASRIPLFTTADYAWNPRDYQPQESWQAAIDDLAGGDAERRRALGALAGNDASSVLGADESAYLVPLMDAFWQARTTTDAARNATAARKLRDAFAVMRQTPQQLHGSALDGEVRPWSGKLAAYGRAGETALSMLDAQARGDGAAAWRDARALERLRRALDASEVTVGKGVLEPFLDRAQRAYATWAGLDREPAVSRSPGDGRTVRFERPRRLTAVTVLTEPGTTGSVEVHLPGGGWHPVGDLSPEGWTEPEWTGSAWSERAGAGAHGRPAAGAGARPTVEGGVRVDAVRVTGPAPSRVRHLVPWFGDTPDVGLSLGRRETDVAIGGATQRVTARLRVLRPGDVHGKLAAKAPKGIEVRVPKASTLPRGTDIHVPVEISAPAGTRAGTYDVPVEFGGEQRTVTVRAFPRTGGPDLARGAEASSSGDETKDFPAGAATDGDPATRWSSPARDGEWWQMRLAAPVRLGQVVLHWQDAYASGYRIQVSSDGRTWRTAATVRDGRGGREVVRMDAQDVRYVRVQGDRRATRFGYSLWSVEAYAVRAETGGVKGDDSHSTGDDGHRAGG
ncbi:beta-N-acetylglucosaminidase domain-containing protein [Streptomyces sp. NPDC002004]